MIISHDEKKICLLVPKTGTTVVRTVLAPYGVRTGILHGTLHGTRYIANQYYGFWRDPVDRFISNYTHMRTYPTVLNKLFPELFSNVQLPEPLTEETFNALPQEIQDRIRYPVDPMELLERVKRVSSVGFKPMHDWLGYPNVTVLNYHDFDSEVRRLIRIFGGDDSIEIPFENVKPRFIPDPPMTDEFRRGIEALYHMDYAYDPR